MAFNIIRIIEVDDFSVARIHDRLLGTFNVDLTEKQIEKLIELVPEYDGSPDTMAMDDLSDQIADHFTGMNVPMGGSPQSVKDEFMRLIPEAKKGILKYVKS